MSCSKHTSEFLQRVIPLYRLGTVAVPTKFVKDTDQIAFNSSEWRHAMCRLYRNLLILHEKHIENDIQREFGNRFISTEFRRSKELDEPYAIKFYKGWMEYGIMIEKGAAKQGQSMSEEQIDSLNEDQKGNLSSFRSKVLESRSAPDVPGGVRTDLK